MYKNILISIDRRILTITINRETKLNALNKDTLNELHLAMADALQNSEVGGIIITGSGTKAFVAGADITELRDLDEIGGLNLATEGQEKVFNFIAGATKPVIAAINGFALGGGLELALACHIRIASENAKLGFPEVSLGLIPGYGGTQRLPQLVGKGKAFELILTGDMIEADMAYKLGILNHVVPADFLINTAVVLLQKILSRSPQAVSAAIRAINSGYSSDGFNTEIEEFSNCFKTSDFKEGTAAFIEKRIANFR
ncbi:enoyl-CoA hydratase/isomerase family protein [Paradesertivirga mongoliensis]|uniref:Enoyl-CoA hydratase/isomerase family protein n=1 Tax=Paradesertivirga mongoliensis TaxID=2100740 RepID=A0ABW4ZHX7_9SPHI|nr:enoyl-CoA hydratase-related protein [Pedobacter mongoliensis]